MQKIYTTTTKIANAIPQHLLIKRHTKLINNAKGIQNTY